MNILIVDDHPSSRKLLRVQLETEGQSVIEAADGVEALAVLERQSMDAVISDILMPNMDGYRLCLEIRKKPKFDALPFIFYTSTYDSPADRQLAQTVGADRYIVKPAAVPVILEALREAAQSGATRRSGRAAKSDTSYVLKQYNETLVAKLEERNTELAAQNEALLKAQQQLRLQATALETAANAILITDRTGAIQWVNPAFTTLTGYMAEEVIGKTPRVLKSGQHDEAFYRNFWQTIISGQTWRGEFINRRKDETVFYGEHTVSPVCSQDGKITHFIGIMNDVTERKAVEEELRTTHAQLRELLAHSPAVIYTLKLDGEKITPAVVSDNIERLLGVTAAESARYEWWLKSLHPEDRDRVLALVSRGMTEGGYTAEYRIRHKDGTYRWVEDNNRVIRDASGQPADAVGVWTDVTERKQAEQRLAAHHAITQALAESSTLAEAAGKILQIVCQKLQWDLGELWTLDRTSNRLRCVEIWHPPSTEFKEFVTVSRQTTFAVGEGLPGRVWQSGQPLLWNADVGESGMTRKALAMRIGLRSSIGFPVRLRDETLGVIDFFSAQMRAPDDELQAMFATVGSQIGQFIERKQIEAQFLQAQKMEAFGQLAGGVAHDFNNILAVIMGYSNLLMSDEEFRPEFREQLKQVYSAGERAANLTRQLLTFSRKKEMQVSPLDLNEVIGNMTRMLGRVIGEDLKLQCNFASKLPAIQADEGMMEQVLMNLAVNARDAMPKGGQLTIGTERVVTDAAYVEGNPEARAGEFVCLSVRDTGCGMTPEIKARIFEPFFTTKGVGKGTGLGLATVFGIVKQHQGWLEVESQVDVGTTFKVFLPASVRPDVAVERAATQAKVRGGNETILLVEDEVALRALTKIILQRHGYRVLEAESGVEALKVWEQHGPQIDLLLTDMVMPDGLTGHELAKQLLARKPDLKLIYTSGYDMYSEGTTFRAREAESFLQKPYHPQKLLETIRAALDRK
jgi:PAS domain S-box-containing protein